MDELGSGIGLDESNDLAVDETGDVAIFSGRMELEKDLALLLLNYLEPGILGQRLTPTVESRLRIRTTNVLLSDPRIESVTGVTVVAGDDSLVVEATCNTTNGETIQVSA